MKKTLLVALWLAFGPFLFAQKTVLAGRVVDASTNEPLIGASVEAKGLNIGAATDAEGRFSLQIPSGERVQLAASYIGYEPFLKEISLKAPQNQLEIRLEPAAGVEEIVISSARTNARIDDLAVKVEALGAEELEEESALVPSGMGSLLGDLSVITIQRTGPVSGNDAVRMQGLAPGYTQLLRDGLPLYGGFAGSLGALSIPPLDLRQVEIVKGSNSTLFGGGAIGGLINFLSRRPEAKPKSTLLLNQTTLGETDANAFFSRKTTAATGWTLFASGSRRPARDLNLDGFAEIPQGLTVNVQPRFFFGMGQKTSGDIGFLLSENRVRGGDFSAVKISSASADHPFFQNETMRRATVSGQIVRSVSKNATWTTRGAMSVFQRGGHYAGLDFVGRQANSYFETNFFIKKQRDGLVVGANLTSEFFKILKAAPSVAFGDFGAAAVGAFAQLDYVFSEKWSLQTGFRLDRNARFGTFALPRASLLFKPSAAWTARLGYGFGYKNPDLFTAAEPVDFGRLQPLAASVRPDRAQSVNGDLSFRKLLAEELLLEIDQAFYLVELRRPFLTSADSTGRIFLQNMTGSGARSLGTDTYLRLHWRGWESYFGYNRTVSRRRLADGLRLNEPFNPQEKIALTLAYSIQKKWRMGIEAAKTARQFAFENRAVPSFWFWAAMVSRQIGPVQLVANCENLFDARQSRHENLVDGTLQKPVFAPVWGPIEGRVANFSMKWDF